MKKMTLVLERVHCIAYYTGVLGAVYPLLYRNGILWMGKRSSFEGGLAV